MSLQDRIAQQGNMGLGRTTSGENLPSQQFGQTIQGKPPVQLFPATRYGIVDGELVEVLGQDDIIGMSPVLWCSDIQTGAYVPVPTREVKHFATPGQALQALQTQGRGQQYTNR